MLNSAMIVMQNSFVCIGVCFQVSDSDTDRNWAFSQCMKQAVTNTLHKMYGTVMNNVFKINNTVMNDVCRIINFGGFIGPEWYQKHKYWHLGANSSYTIALEFCQKGI